MFWLGGYFGLGDNLVRGYFGLGDNLVRGYFGLGILLPGILLKGYFGRRIF